MQRRLPRPGAKGFFLASSSAHPPRRPKSPQLERVQVYPVPSLAMWVVLCWVCMHSKPGICQFILQSVSQSTSQGALIVVMSKGCVGQLRPVELDAYFHA